MTTLDYINLFTHNGLYVGFLVGFIAWGLGYSLHILFKISSM